MAEKRNIPESYFNYELSFPKGMTINREDLSGIVFYVGKGKWTGRLDNHLQEAARGCDCDKCDAIRLVWDAGLIVVRRIVFETSSESESLNNEKVLIGRHMGPYLTNIKRTAMARRLWEICEHLEIDPQDLNEEQQLAWIQADDDARKIFDAVNRAM